MIFSEKQHQQIPLILLVLFCFFFPLLPRIAVFSIVVLSLYMIGSGRIWQQRARAFSFWPLLFLSLYLLYLLGMFYTQNIAEGLLDLESKLSFLLFPPILFALALPENAKRKLLWVFVAGCLTATLYAYARASVNWFAIGENHFYYDRLSGFLKAHPSYLAMYLIFSLFFLLEEFFRRKDKLQLRNKVAYVLLMLHFLLFVFLLTARMQLIIGIFLLSLTLAYFLFGRTQPLKGGLAFLAIVALAGVLVWNVPTTQLRILNAYQQFHDPAVEPNVRVSIWKVAWELFTKAPILGHGTGDVQDNLMPLYQRDQITEAFESSYNSHNQYLQTGIALGAFGLFLLLLLLFGPLYLAIRHRQMLYALFLSLLILSMLTECILEIQQGILFYAFFNSLLASGFLIKKEKAGIH